MCYFLFQSIILTPRKCSEYFFYTKGFPAHNTITNLEVQWFRTGYYNIIQVISVSFSETKTPFSSFYSHSLFETLSYGLRISIRLSIMCWYVLNVELAPSSTHSRHSS
jgi:hypothetical protein